MMPEWLVALLGRLFGAEKGESAPNSELAGTSVGGPPEARHINAGGLDLVKASEGLRLTAYRDSGGILTIGYGHTANVYPGQIITEAQADALLQADLQEAEEAVAAAGLTLTDNQFAALVDFAFNLGDHALAELLAHGVDQVPAQLPRWVHDNGVVLPGLVKRREAEVELWNKG